MLNQKNSVKGHVYLIDVKENLQGGGAVNAIAEVVDFDCTDRAIVKVLNPGRLHNSLLKKGEYAVKEFLADSVNSQHVQAALSPG